MIVAAAILLAMAGVPSVAVEQFQRAERIRSFQPTRAKTLYEQSARSGHAPAQAKLGMLLFKEGNRTEALRWLKAAADQGEPRGMLLWGTALFNGDGVAGDRPVGYALVARAARTLAEAEGTRSEMELVMTPAELSASAKILSPQAPVEGATEADSKSSAKASRGKTKSAKTRIAGKTAPALKASARPAPSEPAATGGWRIQLGAFRLDGSAERLFARLSPQLPSKQPSYLPLGSMTRLLAGPYASKAEAQAACRALGQRQACFPVSPR